VWWSTVAATMFAKCFSVVLVVCLAQGHLAAQQDTQDGKSPRGRIPRDAWNGSHTFGRCAHERHLRKAGASLSKGCVWEGCDPQACAHVSQDRVIPGVKQKAAESRPPLALESPPPRRTARLPCRRGGELNPPDAWARQVPFEDYSAQIVTFDSADQQLKYLLAPIFIFIPGCSFWGGGFLAVFFI